MSKFSDNFRRLLNSREEGSHFADLCLEFLAGGDDFYGGKAPVDTGTWELMSLDEKATALLEMESLESVQLDVFAHQEGFHAQEWSVFDALIFLHSEDFRCELSGLGRKRQELKLEQSLFGSALKCPQPEEEGAPDFLTEEILYKHFRR